MDNVIPISANPWLNFYREDDGITIRMGAPDWITKAEKALSTGLGKWGDHWGLITAWYAAVRNGGRNPIIRDHVKTIVKRGEAFWDSEKRDPDAIMAEIAEIVGWGRGAVSISQRAASVRPIWRGDKTVQDRSPEHSDLSDESGLSALLAIRAELQEFSKEVEGHKAGNFDRYPGSYANKTADLIPSGMPDRETLFRLMRRAEAMAAFQADIDAEWPQFLGKSHGVLVSAFWEALNQFQVKRQFEREVLEIEIREADPAEIDGLLSNAVDVLESETGLRRVDPELPSIVRNVGGEIEQLTPAASDALRVSAQADQLQSLSNIARRLAERPDDPETQMILRDMDHAYQTEFKEGLVEGARMAGRQQGEIAGKAIMTAKTGASIGRVGAKRLSDWSPRLFGFLKKFD